MQNEIQTISQHLFHKDRLENLSDEELQDFISKYPYVAPARVLLARRKYLENGGASTDEIVTAGLYGNNPLWMNWQLSREDRQAPVAAIEQAASEDKAAEAESPISFQSYHTIDYFASQGIRLQQADLGKDKLGQQLKSFTEWLRSMKKLPSAEGQPSAPEDTNRQQMVIQHAASSIAEKEVMTEAMAEVWLKQGNHAKAAEIYHKLSLQNPSKSSYFAAKIDQLK